MLGPFTFTFTFESEEFEKFEKVAAAAAADLYQPMITTRAPDGAKNTHLSLRFIKLQKQPDLKNLNMSINASFTFLQADLRKINIEIGNSTSSSFDLHHSLEDVDQ